MRILALSSWWPEPTNNGSRLRIARLLRALAREHEVHLVALAQEPVRLDHCERLEQVVASVGTVPERPWIPRNAQLLTSLLRREPSSVRATYNPEYAAMVVDRTREVRPDAVIAFEIRAAAYAHLVQGVPRVLDQLEISRQWERFVRERNPRRRLRSYLTWWKQRAYLQHLLRDFHACTVVSELERSRAPLLRCRLPHIAIIPNGADVPPNGRHWDDAEADTLIYPGAMSYDANFDAMSYFVHSIFPLVRRARPHVRLRITGQADSHHREALKANGVEWVGEVPDVRPLVTQSWAEVVPLRIGEGTRLKVLEALALGTPVVSTSKGVEGLDVSHDQQVLVADSPDDFARTTIRLLSDRDLRSRLSLAGQQVVRDKYDWQMIGRQFTRLVEEICVQPRKSL